MEKGIWLMTLLHLLISGHSKCKRVYRCHRHNSFCRQGNSSNSKERSKLKKPSVLYQPVETPSPSSSTVIALQDNFFNIYFPLRPHCSLPVHHRLRRRAIYNETRMKNQPQKTKNGTTSLFRIIQRLHTDNGRRYWVTRFNCSSSTI